MKSKVMILIFVFSILGYNGSEALTFTDVASEDWFHEDVTTLSASGIINGFPDGSFKPDSEIHIDQFIKLLVVALGYDLQNGSVYWAQPFIEKGQEIGLFEFAEFDSYEQPISRGEMATLISRGLMENFSNRMYEYAFFMKDYEESGTREILKAFSLGIVTGYPDGAFYPLRTATRAEASTMLMRLIAENRRVDTHRLNRLMGEFTALDEQLKEDLSEHQEAREILLQQTPILLDNGDALYRLQGLDIEGYRWANGDLYIGTMVQGGIDGFGYFSWINGTHYIGEIEEGLIHGQGSMAFGTATYTGEFNRGEMTGEAMVVWEDDDVFVGEYVRGALTGLGMHQDPAGERYLGQYLKGAKEGRGIYTYAGGLTYFGTFNQEYRDGDDFTMYYRDSGDTAFEDMAGRILDEALSQGMGVNEKIRSIHDALARHITYDSEGYSSGEVEDEAHTAYGALVEGTAVCDGYAEAFNLLLNRAGIKSDLVIGEALGEGHAWNLVEFEEGFYHVDLTWNDLDNGRISDAYYKISLDEIQKDHLIERIIQ
ncbi:MAG: hypothetical protein AVO33_09430 [delta proteobacterium ML8_F1]|nr:MAG: hypothetical protein AVO33_09430 [delta proteobacterium ML8_F1]